MLSSAIFHPHFSIRHPPPFGPHFTETHNPTRLSIEMMYQLAHYFGHRRESGLDWVPIVLSFRGYVSSARCKKFEGKFRVALCSFGGVIDQRGATSWAAHETGMLPLLSSEIDIHDWMVKGKVQWVMCIQVKTWSYQLTKATGDSKYQLGIIHAHKWLLSRPSGLFLLPQYVTILSSQIVCLWRRFPKVIYLVLAKRN